MPSLNQHKFLQRHPSYDEERKHALINVIGTVEEIMDACYQDFKIYGLVLREDFEFVYEE